MSDSHEPNSYELVLTFPRSKRQIRAGFKIPVNCGGVYVTDPAGHEHHFGGAELELVGHEYYVFAEYIATYGEAGVEAEFDNAVGAGDLDGSANASLTPSNGPLLPETAFTALRGMAESCNQNNGTAQEYEKREIVLTALALTRTGLGLPRQEIENWAATHGWTIGQARDIGDLMERAAQGRSFSPAIRLTDEMFDRFVKFWDAAAERAA